MCSERFSLALGFTLGTAKVHLYTLCVLYKYLQEKQVEKLDLFQLFMAKENYIPVFCSPSQFLPGRDGLVSTVVLHLHRYDPITLMQSANMEQSFSAWEAHSSQSVRAKPDQSDSPPTGCTKLEIFTNQSFLQHLNLRMWSAFFTICLTDKLRELQNAICVVVLSHKN